MAGKRRKTSGSLPLQSLLTVDLSNDSGYKLRNRCFQVPLLELGDEVVAKRATLGGRFSTNENGCVQVLIFNPLVNECELRQPRSKHP